MNCTFFGHRDTPKEIEHQLQTVIENLIEKENVRTFYVGCQGNFDLMVISALSRLKEKYSIEFFVVLSYLTEAQKYKNCDTIYPEGIEAVPPKFAISFRNRWMIEKSDFVVAYVSRPFGGAANFFEISKRKNKTVINIYKDV